VAVAPLSTSEVVDAVTSDTTLEMALRISETTGATSDEVAAASLDVGVASSEVAASVLTATSEVGATSVVMALAISEAMLSTTDDSAAVSVGTVPLIPTTTVPFRPVGRAPDEIHVAATMGIVSTE